jgi:uncharacterized membrane protein YtjA (UPF0391 family)
LRQSLSPSAVMGNAPAAVGIAKIAFFVFLVLAVIAFLF